MTKRIGNLTLGIIIFIIIVLTFTNKVLAIEDNNNETDKIRKELLDDKYILAKDDDFKKVEGVYKYIGNHDYVIVPDTINNEKITSHKDMFQGNNSIKGVASFNPHLKDISYTFSFIMEPDDLELTHYNTSNVTNMFRTFKGTRVNELIGIDEWNVSKVKNMEETFSGLRTDHSIEIDSWDVSNVENMMGLFMDAKFSKDNFKDNSNDNSNDNMILDLNSWQLKSVTNIEYIFGGIEVNELKIDKWEFPKVTSLKNLFSNMKISEQLDLNEWDVSKITNMESIFAITYPKNALKYQLPKVSEWDVSNVKKFDNAFKHHIITEGPYDIEKWNVRNPDSIRNIFQNSEFKVPLNLTNWLIEDETNVSEWNKDMKAKEVIVATPKIFDKLFPKNSDQENGKLEGQYYIDSLGYDYAEDSEFIVEDNNYIYNGYKQKIIIPRFIKGEEIKSHNLMFKNRRENISIISFNENIESAEEMFLNFMGNNLEIVRYNGKSLNTVSGMFKDYSGVNAPKIEGLDGSNVKDASSLFEGYNGASKLELRNFNKIFKNIINMDRMFKDYYSETPDRLDCMEVSSVESFESTFENYMVKDEDKLNLKNWKLGENVNTKNMFKNTKAKYGEVDDSNTAYIFNNSEGKTKELFFNASENPGTEDPENPGTTDPENPGTEDPENPGTEDPENPGTTDPENPGTEDPENPGTTDPENPGIEDNNSSSDSDDRPYEFAPANKEKEENLKVKYDKNTDTEVTNIPNDTKKYKKGSQTIILSGNLMERKGYKFVSWNTQIDGKGKEYKGGEKVKIDENLTLYAQWEKEDENKHIAYLFGFKDGTIRPNEIVTRSEVATIYYRVLEELEIEKPENISNEFIDINDSMLYKDAVLTLNNLNIINGYLDGTFRPNDNITRAEFAALTSRLLKEDYEYEKSNINLKDIEKHWGREEIEKLISLGLMDGYPDGTFRPEENITRAEVVKVVNRLLGRKPNKELFTDDIKIWKDVKENSWYYADIQEASNSHEYELDSQGNVEIWLNLIEE